MTLSFELRDLSGIPLQCHQNVLKGQKHTVSILGSSLCVKLHPQLKTPQPQDEELAPLKKNEAVREGLVAEKNYSCYFCSPKHHRKHIVSVIFAKFVKNQVLGSVHANSSSRDALFFSQILT